MMEYEQKECKICGKLFLQKVMRQTCCSPECSAKNRHRVPKKIMTCHVCGQEFIAYLSTAKYCSAHCANQANNSSKSESLISAKEDLHRYEPQPRKCPGLPWARCRNLLPPSWPRYRCADCDRKWRKRYNLHAYDDAALNDD